MSRVKIVLRGILGFICSILLFLIVIVSIIKLTVYNKNYVLKSIENDDYYSKVYEEINSDMKNSLLSSGLDESILKGLFTKNDLKKETKNLIGSIYSGSNYKVDTDTFKERLNTNIDKFLKEKNIQVTDQKSLDTFVSNIVSVYEKEISLYGYLQNYVNKFVKIGNLLDVAMIVMIILLLICFIILRYPLHRRYSGVICMSACLMLLFFKSYIYEQIDMKNILIISDSFSSLLRRVLLDINDKMLLSAFILLIVGILLNLKNSFLRRRKKRVRRLS